MKICTDGWCSGSPGKGGWRAVDLTTKKELLRRDITIGTNNLMEFFGLIDTIRWIKQHNLNQKVVIYTDSRCAISWYNNKRVKSNIKVEKVKEAIKKSEQYLYKTDLSNITIIKWNTKKYGEIPADFGRKKTR